MKNGTSQILVFSGIFRFGVRVSLWRNRNSLMGTSKNVLLMRDRAQVRIES